MACAGWLAFCLGKQLVSQWRELNSIFKKQDNHILINFVYDCPKEHLMYYANLIIHEFENRGYKIKSLDNYNTYFEGIQAPIYIAPANLFNGKMSDRYLRQCLYNLQKNLMQMEYLKTNGYQYMINLKINLNYGRKKNEYKRKL